MLTIISKPGSHVATVTLHSYVTDANKTNEKVATMLPLILGQRSCFCITRTAKGWKIFHHTITRVCDHLGTSFWCLSPFFMFLTQ